MRRTLISALMIAVFSAAAWAAAAAYQVEWKGRLRDTHAGDVSGKVALAELPRSPRLYAVGPVTGLGGEVTVVDGRLHLARVEHGAVKTSTDYEGQASFLVWATVPAWQDAVRLGTAASSQADLEKLVEARARSAGVDTGKAFPFLVRGTVKSVDYHVLKPAEARAGHGASVGHGDSALNLKASGERVTIIGFYSKAHEGVFTHHGSYAHLHVILPNGDSGHVDELEVGPEIELLLPRS
jgi:acetolactate decarboxylase